MQDAPIESMVEALHRGHLILDEARFRPADDRLIDGAEPALERTARALSRAEGRFLVFVPIERDRTLPPDTVLGRRRAETALRRLLAAGSNPSRLIESPDGLRRRWSLLRPVAQGQARIELWKID